MSKQLVLARDQLKYAHAGTNPCAAKILDKYGELLSMYRDSAKVWQLQIQDKKHDSDLPAIALKYGASSAIREWTDRRFGIATKERSIDCDQIRQLIWSKASQIQEEQTAEAYRSFAAIPSQQRK
jgi:hypothetical protein